MLGRIPLVESIGSFQVSGACGKLRQNGLYTIAPGPTITVTELLPSVSVLQCPASIKSITDTNRDLYELPKSELPRLNGSLLSRT